MQFQDCEFVANNGRTQAQVLQEQIAIVETRIDALEHPSEDALMLENPYAPTTSVSPRYIPSLRTLQHLVQAFLSGHAAKMGYFLWSCDVNHASLGLQSAVQLWALHLSHNAEHQAHESTWLQRVLSSQPASSPIETIQTAVLLATYFFTHDRIREGKYHLSLAAGTVLSAGFHQLRLPSTRREADHVAAFWTVFTLNNCWNASDAAPFNTTYDEEPQLRIMTPWPGEDITAVDTRGRHGQTVANFVGRQVHADAGSKEALLAKSGILYERACHIGRQYEAYVHQSDFDNLARAFASLDELVEDLKRSALAQTIREIPFQNADLLTCCLLHAATIELHRPFLTQRGGNSQQRVLEAAKAVVSHLESLALRHASDDVANPVLAVLLDSMAKALFAVSGDIPSAAPTNHTQRLKLVLLSGLPSVKGA
ncbi:Transcription factor [Mycena indigotica]|uniref:Transcription factor n=1 Tax=Mycena indigotica TaxID=2126181 RepID=A0A8H6S245_9AGAR|nr:Transcription factor [Mycena indigotica]KAF7291268.1 Transcription factor [Mycena indigotica]